MTERDDLRKEIQELIHSTPMRRGHISRRDLLKRMGIGAGALSATALLAACGVSGTSDDKPSASGTTEAPSLSGQDPAGELAFANWPLYIDRAQGRRPTIDDFTKATDIKVDYKEVIDDNESFFGTIREPLNAGQSTGWDLIVVTDWLIAKMNRLGYLEQLDHELLPNFAAHAGEVYKNPDYDPNNAHSVPWQSGITGIGYNPKLTGRKITSFNDLFDPAFKGKVGMMTEMRDTMNLTLLGMGIQPGDATVEDAEAASKKLLEQRDQGIVRDYYGNNYADALAREDLWLTMAWSGDVFQLQFDKPELEFVVPEEGGILWVDNMAIPAGAEHPVDAHLFMDFVYDPAIVAQIAGWVNGICPVPEAQEILAKAKDKYTQTVANSPLVFPTPEMEARLHHYKDLDEEEEIAWNEFFGSVVEGRSAAPGQSKKGLVPYLLTLPGGLWLIGLFLVPMATMFSISLQEGSLEKGFVFTGRWQTYLDALSKYDTQLYRSLLYGLIVTLATLAISYPMAYWIAFRGGRNKNLFLLLILLPFFTPFIIRTLSWKFILADEGIFLGTLKDWGLLADTYQVLATPTAVISGMIYNFLPFMALPLYVALERLDPALLDAASDLYSNKVQAFLRVTLPLSLPGVFAGSLLTFIPSVGDFINPDLLGGVNTTLIGNVIQREFQTTFDFPEGAALSFLLMAGILIGVALYARALGTEELT